MKTISHNIKTSTNKNKAQPNKLVLRLTNV